MINKDRLQVSKMEVVSTLLKKAETLKSLNIDEQHTVEINIGAIPKFQSRAKRGSRYYMAGLKELGLGKAMEEKRGAVYVFHLPEEFDKGIIIKALIDCKKKGRAIPSLENIDDRQFNVLYIGSIKSHFYTRVYQHLGYGTPKTGALQLLHWAPKLFSKIRMTYLPIEFSSLALHHQMEIAMCKTKIPMIGRMEKDKIKE